MTIRIFRDEASALRRLQELARQNRGVTYAALSRKFGAENRWIVCRRGLRNGRVCYIPTT